MIVSDAVGAGSRGRSRYFLVSGLVIGTLFFSAVVLSIYAAELSLGTEEFELSMMLAPDAPETPEPPRAELPRPQNQVPQSELPRRNQNMLRPDEQPVAVPDSVSVEKNTSMARPPGEFEIGKGTETKEVGVPEGFGRGRNGEEVVGSSSSNEVVPETTAVKIPEPPPAIERKPGPTKSLGVITGKATHLPKPTYTAAAVAMNAQGDVTVQVTIDEHGKVISAKAIKGHPLLTREAERAALNARFSPTTLSKVPVKVAGIIVYNFKRN